MTGLQRSIAGCKRVLKRNRVPHLQATDNWWNSAVLYFYAYASHVIYYLYTVSFCQL